MFYSHERIPFIKQRKMVSFWKKHNHFSLFMTHEQWEDMISWWKAFSACYTLRMEWWKKFFYRIYTVYVVYDLYKKQHCAGRDWLLGKSVFLCIKTNISLWTKIKSFFWMSNSPTTKGPFFVNPHTLVCPLIKNRRYWDIWYLAITHWNPIS